MLWLTPKPKALIVPEPLKEWTEADWDPYKRVENDASHTAEAFLAQVSGLGRDLGFQGFRVWGFRVWGFRDLGFRLSFFLILGVGLYRVLRFRVWGVRRVSWSVLWFRVCGLGCSWGLGV